MTPPAPDTFSITTGCPSRVASSGAIQRAMTSTLPPAP